MKTTFSRCFIRKYCSIRWTNHGKCRLLLIDRSRRRCPVKSVRQATFFQGIIFVWLYDNNHLPIFSVQWKSYACRTNFMVLKRGRKDWLWYISHEKNGLTAPGASFVSFFRPAKSLIKYSPLCRKGCFSLGRQYAYDEFSVDFWWWFQIFQQKRSNLEFFLKFLAAAINFPYLILP